MKNPINSPIEYVGLEKCPNILYKNFSELNLTHHLNLTENKPPINSLISANINFLIKSSKIINTIKGYSLEGIHLTGYKLVIHGALEEKIQYADNSSKSTIHNTAFTIPFSNFIVIPENINKDINLNEIKIYIQHISTKIKSAHHLYQDINTIVCY